MPTHNTLVLVHGAWGGAWVWRRALAPGRSGHGHFPMLTPPEALTRLLLELS